VDASLPRSHFKTFAKTVRPTGHNERKGRSLALLGWANRIKIFSHERLRGETFQFVAVEQHCKINSVSLNPLQDVTAHSFNHPQADVRELTTNGFDKWYRKN
jgi:hypothetical protein